MVTNSSVQVRVDLTAIPNCVACFGSRDEAEYRAVMEIAGSQESLAKADDAKREELLAAYAQFLNSVTFPFQLIVQVHPAWSNSAEEASTSSSFPLIRLLGKKRRTDGPAREHLRSETVLRLLGDRCEVIARQLSRAGLRATRLDDLGLAQRYHVGWAPEVARTQRLRRELADYTAVVVGAEPRPWRQDLSARELRGHGKAEFRALDLWKSK